MATSQSGYTIAVSLFVAGLKSKKGCILTNERKLMRQKTWNIQDSYALPSYKGQGAPHTEDTEYSQSWFCPGICCMSSWIAFTEAFKQVLCRKGNFRRNPNSRLASFFQESCGPKDTKPTWIKTRNGTQSVCLWQTLLSKATYTHIPGRQVA